jgi:beta-phosphoglucomutase-like phosphatase (HAD superfamily)
LDHRGTEGTERSKEDLFSVPSVPLWFICIKHTDVNNQPIGFIFDMDDTIARTAPIWRAAECALLDRVGAAWSEELALQYKGMNAPDVAATIHRLLAPPLAVAECQRVMRDALLDGFRAGRATEMAGAAACVRRMARLGPAALASGSPLPGMRLVLEQLGLSDAFKVVISSESVPRGKPHPDVFLAAAVVLEVPPERCLVFEDSLVGVRAARAAGMRCFAVPSSHPQEIAQIATGVFTSWDEVAECDVRAAFP